MTRFFFSLSFARQLLCSSSLGALSDERPGLQFVVQSVSSQSRGGLTTIHYCLIWDYWFHFPSPLNDSQRLWWKYFNPPPQVDTHTAASKFEISLRLTVGQYVLVSSTFVGLATRYYFRSECCCLKFASQVRSSYITTVSRPACLSLRQPFRTFGLLSWFIFR
jgi:hypothetical protein